MTNRIAKLLEFVTFLTQIDDDQIKRPIVREHDSRQRLKPRTPFIGVGNFQCFSTSSELHYHSNSEPRLKNGVGKTINQCLRV